MLTIDHDDPNVNKTVKPIINKKILSATSAGPRGGQAV
jgi:hypothetical protein